MKKWYVLHTVLNREQMGAQFLKRHGFDTFLPEISTVAAGATKRRTPLFPGYLFIHIDLDEENHPLHWQCMPGVRYLVSYGDCPVPVPDEIIGLVRRKIEDLDDPNRGTAARFEPGELVRINSGPFKEMLAIFDGPITPSASVHVLLCGIRNAARLRIPPSELEKVFAPAASAPMRRRRTRGHGRYINYKQSQ